MQNAELFALTYGALVVQLIQDYEDYAEVNKQLEKMGYNIGTRLIEDFLAKSNLGRCSDFREVGEVVSKVIYVLLKYWPAIDSSSQVGFKSFLNISPSVTHGAPPSTSTSPRPMSTGSAAPTATSGAYFTLTLDENPLAEFVELPEDALEGGLWFSNVLCGVLRGALEMVQMQVQAEFVSDVLRGDETTEIRVRLIKTLDEEIPVGDD